MAATTGVKSPTKPPCNMIRWCILALFCVVLVTDAHGDVPDWMQQVVIWWNEGYISDDELLTTISYGINEGLVDDAEDIIASVLPDYCIGYGRQVEVITWSLDVDEIPGAWLLTFDDRDAVLQSIESGFNAWSKDNPLEFHHSTQASVCGYPHISVTSDAYDDARAIGMAHIDSLYDDPIISLNEKWLFTPPLLRQTTSHEFGHVLGLEHHFEDPLHLMWPIYHGTWLATVCPDTWVDKDGTITTSPYNTLGFEIPKTTYEYESPFPTQHPASDFFIVITQYERDMGTLSITFSQAVRSIDPSKIFMTELHIDSSTIYTHGSDGISSHLRNANVTYDNNVATLTLTERTAEYFEDMENGFLSIREHAIQRYDSTSMLPHDRVCVHVYGEST